MTRESSCSSRRNVLKLTGATLAAVTASGVVSADHEHADVETVGTYRINYDTIRLYGDLLNIGASADMAHVWFQWGRTSDGFTNTTHPQSMYSTGEFTDTLSGLNGYYQFRAAAKDNDDLRTTYGETRYFTIGDPQ